MKIYEIEVDEYFKLDKILYGQCFRWKKQEKGYIGVIEDNVIKVWQENNKIYYYGYNEDNIEKVFHDYFDLNTNYKEIVEKIQYNCNNSLLNEIIQYSKGTRILNQSMFEIAISYIFSASNNIPRIEGSIEKLCKMYGEKVIFEDKEYYLFPTIQQLKGITEMILKDKIRIGFRAPYVDDTIKKIYNSLYNLENICNMETLDARKKLIEFKGVGPKVADCILLFSMKKKDVFPVDTWIEKVMKSYCSNDKLKKKEIEEISKKQFGEFRGIINHYMFYWGRENKVK